MDRRELLLSLFDSGNFGLEVGPSYNPFLPKRKGYNVETVDYASADVLREKYRPDPTIDISNIEDPTYISDGRSLLDLIGEPGRYDFILASHVIEHVTDIIRFVQDCETLLKPEGKLVLAVPDKRFCFDALRPLSTIGQALQAYQEKRERHPYGALFDYAISVAHKNDNIVWSDPDMDGLATLNSPEFAFKIFEDAQKSNEYRDIHAWVFTPSYFRYFIKTLRALGFIKSGELVFVKNSQEDNRPMQEFYVVLSKAAPLSEQIDIQLLIESEKELREIRIAPGPSVDQLKNELKQEKERYLELVSSNSWKITHPLRAIKRRISHGA